MVESGTAGEQVLIRTFRETHHDLMGVLFGVLRNWEDARDAAQTAFLKCWKVRHELHNVRDVRAWLFRISLNTARDIRRREGLRRAVPIDALGESVSNPAALSTEDELIHRERLRHLQTALRELRPSEREVFILRQDTGLTYEEIAEARGYPVGTVKTLMRAALRKLRARLVEGRAPAPTATPPACPAGAASRQKACSAFSSASSVNDPAKRARYTAPAPQPRAQRSAVVPAGSTRPSAMASSSSHASPALTRPSSKPPSANGSSANDQGG
jgi:RNA polymerase sigma-70 factor (ECF subfamily)